MEAQQTKAPDKVQIISNGEDASAYDLVVDGKVSIQAESLAICDAIRDHLLGIREWEPSEVCEVAEVIREDI